MISWLSKVRRNEPPALVAPPAKQTYIYGPPNDILFRILSCLDVITLTKLNLTSKPLRAKVSVFLDSKEAKEWFLYGRDFPHLFPEVRISCRFLPREYIIYRLSSGIFSSKKLDEENTLRGLRSLNPEDLFKIFNSNIFYQENMRVFSQYVCNIARHFHLVPAESPSLLFKAAPLGHLGLVQILLDFKTSPNPRDENGETALYRVAGTAHHLVMKALLELEANPNICTTKGQSPLHNHIKSASNRDEQTNVNMMQLLLTHRADLTATDNEGHTALCLAVKTRYLSGVILLLENGQRSDVAHLCSGGCTIFTYLMRKIVRDFNRIDANIMVQLFMTHPGIIDRGRLIHQAISYEPLKHQPDSEQVQQSRTAVVKYLLDVRGDPNLRDRKGNAPLHYAAAFPRLMEMLLSARADINAQDAKGNTALHLAFSNPNSVDLLTQHKIDHSIVNKDGKTAIQLASSQLHKTTASLRHAEYRIQNEAKRPKSPGYLLIDGEG